MSEEIRIVNHEEPGRPLKVRRLADGRVEVRIGDMGITDAVVTITPEEFGVKGQNVCLARRVAGVRFGLFECRLSGCSRCR